MAWLDGGWKSVTNHYGMRQYADDLIYTDRKWILEKGLLKSKVNTAQCVTPQGWMDGSFSKTSETFVIDTWEQAPLCTDIEKKDVNTAWQWNDAKDNLFMQVGESHQLCLSVTGKGAVTTLNELRKCDHSQEQIFLTPSYLSQSCPTLIKVTCTLALAMALSYSVTLAEHKRPKFPRLTGPFMTLTPLTNTVVGFTVSPTRNFTVAETSNFALLLE